MSTTDSQNTVTDSDHGLCFFEIKAKHYFGIFKDGPPNTEVFLICTVNTYAGNADLGKCHWNLKRKLWVAKHFSEIITIIPRNFKNISKDCAIIVRIIVSILVRIEKLNVIFCCGQNTFVLVRPSSRNSEFLGSSRDALNVCAAIKHRH